MNVDVLTEIKIHCPRDLVANYASDPNNAPKWYVNIKAVELKTPGPLKIGSQMTFIAHFLGRRLEYTYEVTEFLSGSKFQMKTAEGPFPMETTYEWKEIDSNTTQMTLRNRGTPTGFSALLAPFMSAAMRRANRKDLTLLKRMLESSAGHISK
ncbi:MAG: SRPBCC family protein [Bdellovibrionales bacterium]